MQVFGLAGDAGATLDPLVERVTARLDERGRVAVVEAGDVAATRTRVTLDADAWRAEGERKDLGAVLDDLACDHDYALVVGFPDARVPQVAVGDADVRNPEIEAARAEDVDVEAVLAAVETADAHESLASLVARAKHSEAAEYAGAIATFTGRVRAREGPDDEFTESLTFEKYEGVAEDRLAALREDLEARDGVYEVLMHHRTGTIPYGEDIVFVVVLAGHRREAFETVEDGIDRLKAEVPIFKKEVTVGDEFWVHDRD